jgi:hypothetical protein
MPGSSLYAADQLIDKTLIAAQAVPVYRIANDHAVPFGSIGKGNPVGVVYSYLMPNPTYDRSTLWWAFYDAYNNMYFSKMLPGAYDISALQEQGILTVQEQIEEEKEKNKPWYEQLIDKYGPPLLYTVAGVAVATAIIRGFLSRPKRD